MHPYIALGTHRGYRYRLVPCLDELAPQPGMALVNRPDNVKLFHPAILGLNIGSPHKIIENCNTRAEAFCEKPTSNNSLATGNDSTGFTFVQLGRVDYVEEKQYVKGKAAGKGSAEHHWGDSYYTLGAVINADGRTGEI